MEVSRQVVVWNHSASHRESRHSEGNNTRASRISEQSKRVVVAQEQAPVHVEKTQNHYKVRRERNWNNVKNTFLLTSSRGFILVVVNRVI